MNLQLYQLAAKLGAEYGVPAAHVAAIVEVESGGAYEPCSIRFEGHYFHDRLTEPTRSRAVKAGLASAKMGGVKNPRSMDARYALLERACAINRQAAIESTSWGVGQVMGAHWRVLGFASADAFRLEALSGVEGQARLMMRYLKRFGLLDELAAGQWAALARGYNGPAYRKFGYDTKLAAAAARHGGRTEAPDGMLRLGAQGMRVRELQVLLARAGENVRVDGDYGQTTRDAVSSMQARAGLDADGVAGPETMAAISTWRTSPDEKLGARRLVDIPDFGKVAGGVLSAGGMLEAKGQLEDAAARVGDVAGKLTMIPKISAYAEMAASGLVAVAAVVGVAALAYGAWHWIRAGRTYEGVST